MWKIDKSKISSYNSFEILWSWSPYRERRVRMVDRPSHHRTEYDDAMSFCRAHEKSMGYTVIQNMEAYPGKYFTFQLRPPNEDIGDPLPTYRINNFFENTLSYTSRIFNPANGYGNDHVFDHDKNINFTIIDIRTNKTAMWKKTWRLLNQRGDNAEILFKLPLTAGWKPGKYKFYVYTKGCANWRREGVQYQWLGTNSSLVSFDIVLVRTVSDTIILVVVIWSVTVVTGLAIYVCCRARIGQDIWFIESLRQHAEQEKRRGGRRVSIGEHTIAMRNKAYVDRRKMSSFRASASGRDPFAGPNELSYQNQRLGTVRSRDDIKSMVAEWEIDTEQIPERSHTSKDPGMTLHEESEVYYVTNTVDTEAATMAIFEARANVKRSSKDSIMDYDHFRAPDLDNSPDVGSPSADSRVWIERHMSDRSDQVKPSVSLRSKAPQTTQAADYWSEQGDHHQSMSRELDLRVSVGGSARTQHRKSVESTRAADQMEVSMQDTSLRPFALNPNEPHEEQLRGGNLCGGSVRTVGTRTNISNEMNVNVLSEPLLGGNKERAVT